MKKDIYKIDNSIDRLLNGKNTLFLDNSEFDQIKSKIGKNKYKVYLPYIDSEKVILYINDLPKVSLFEIESKNTLKHNHILGSLLSLNINPSFLGDIIIDNDKYYFFILSELKDFVINNFKSVSNYKINVKELDVDYLKDYKRKYEELNLIVPSLRIDIILSRIIKTNRDTIQNKIKNKEVILNYKVLSKPSYVLKENDAFSIRRFGKYKYIKILKNTKKSNYIILVLKYI